MMRIIGGQLSVCSPMFNDSHIPSSGQLMGAPQWSVNGCMWPKVQFAFRCRLSRRYIVLFASIMMGRSVSC